MISTAAASSATTNLEAAEVPEQLRNQLDVLIKAMEDDKRCYAEIRDIKMSDEMRVLEERYAKVMSLMDQQRSALKRERFRNAEMAKKIGLDQRIAHNIQRTRDNLAKNPQFGRVHSVDFLHEVAAQNEQMLPEQWDTMEKLKQMLERLQKADEEPALSRNSLSEHINRFDKIFEQVANQVYSMNDAVEKLRDLFIDQRRKCGGRFGFVDPFEKQKERRKVIDAYSALKGVDAFPTPNAMLSLTEYLSKQPSVLAQPQFGSSPFGQTQQVGGGLFGAAKPNFSFTTPTTQPSLFGASKPTTAFGMPTITSASATIPFGAPATTLASASLPLFGASSTTPTAGAASVAAQPQTPATAQPTFGFSNTLSSASSGTLFKGPAAAKPNNLFGSK